VLVIVVCVCVWGVCVCVCVCVCVQYTVEQCVFLFELCVKCDFARKCQTKPCLKFHRIRVPSTTGIHKFINKVSSNGSLLVKKCARNEKNTVCLPKGK
jgi:hypothetical protein